MGNAITILAIVALVVFGVVALGGALDSMAQSNAAAATANAWATVNVAQIESDTQIRLQELAMLDSAYTRAMLAAFFWPVMALAGLTLAAVVWVQVWIASRRPHYPQPQRQQLPGAGWRPALPAPRETRWQAEQWQREEERVPERWDYEVYP